jgi:hypothetical protein
MKIFRKPASDSLDSVETDNVLPHDVVSKYDLSGINMGFISLYYDNLNITKKSHSERLSLATIEMSFLDIMHNYMHTYKSISRGRDAFENAEHSKEKKRKAISSAKRLNYSNENYIIESKIKDLSNDAQSGCLAYKLRKKPLYLTSNHDYIIKDFLIPIASSFIIQQKSGLHKEFNLSKLFELKIKNDAYLMLEYGNNYWSEFIQGALLMNVNDINDLPDLKTCKNNNMYWGIIEKLITCHRYDDMNIAEICKLIKRETKIRFHHVEN